MIPNTTVSNNQPESPGFKYGEEQVMGLVPDVKRATLAAAERWFIVYTQHALYFVFCGDGKQLQEEFTNKTLEQLLRKGSYFYRVPVSLINNIKPVHGWLGKKVILILPTGKVKFHLNAEDFEKVQSWFGTLGGTSTSFGLPAAPLVKEIVDSAPIT